MAERKRVAEKKVDAVAKTVSFRDLTVANGATFIADYTKLPADIQVRLGLHGIAQKLGDTYADGDSPMAGVKAAFDSLMAGEWSQRGEAGPRDTVLIEALASIHPDTVGMFKTDRDGAIAKVRELLDRSVAVAAKQKNVNPDDEKAFETFTAGFMKDLRSKPNVKAEMAAISLRRAQDLAKKAKDAAKGTDAGLGF